jgi:hypothetical protein
MVTPAVTYAAYAHQLEHGHPVVSAVLEPFRDRRPGAGQCELDPNTGCDSHDASNAVSTYWTIRARVIVFDSPTELRTCQVDWSGNARFQIDGCEAKSD